MVVIVMGVSGAGKTTVGTRLARALGWTFRDGDDYHSPDGIAKMSGGLALTDVDREPWLERMREVIAQALAADEGLVLACSALKESYRRRLSVDAAREKWVYLHVSREVLAERLANRRGHFMSAALLDSQLATLEVPQVALSVDASATPDEMVAHILQALGLQTPG